MDTFALMSRIDDGSVVDLLDKMGTYVRVVEAGSFSAAAKQLRISSAAVSRQIAALEADLRAALLLRTTRRMSVTSAGQRYYERCIRILREVEDARTVGREDRFDGHLTVSAPVTFGVARVVPHIHALMRAHPGLRIDLRLEDRLVDLVGEGIDVAIRVGSPPPESTGVIAHRLVAYSRVLVAAPGYLKRRGEPKTPEALAKHDAVAHASGTVSDAWTLRRGEREVRALANVTFRSNAPFAVRELVVQGAGVGLLPDWFVAPYVDRGVLRVLLADWTTDGVTVNALHRTEHRGALRVRAFIEHLRASYAADVPTSPRGKRPRRDPRRDAMRRGALGTSVAP
jgi:DNA-binding transcriptional LysR family regulator